MRKYWYVLSVGIQNTLVYRVNFLARACLGLIPLSATLFLWRAIYEGKEKGTSIEGYVYSQMVLYYLVVTIVDGLTAVAEDDWQIAADIKDGQISQFLLKPINYLGYRLVRYFGGRAIYTTVALIPISLFIYLQGEHFSLPKETSTGLLFLSSVVLAGMLQFLISFTMALLAFWVTEVSTFIFILFAFESLAGGHFFPLDILPEEIRTLLWFSPFPYEMFFPVSVYLGRVKGEELVAGFAMQVFWVGFMYLVSRVVWRKGLKRYTATGG